VQSVCNQTGLNTAKQPLQTAGPLQHDTVLIDQVAQDEAAEAVAKATKGYDTLAVGNRCGLRLVLSFSTVSVLWLQTPAYGHLSAGPVQWSQQHPGAPARASV
jgi:hypothetical protein